ncbi:hypothetical protein G6F24_015912 [Rhizopus arrhizus]|nr:hypothetical protein G6F24_015912 [Rhizopus arrhizus]
MGQVVTGGILGVGAAAADHLAGAGDRYQAQHVVAAGAVLHRARAAGIAGQVAAHAADVRAGRARRPEQAVRCQRLLQCAVQHPRLHHRAAVTGADFKNAVHAGERQHDAARQWHRRTRGAGACAACDQCAAMRAARPHRRLHLLHLGGQRHGRGALVAP